MACCQVSLDSGEQFQRSIRICLSQSEAGAILDFRSAQKIKLCRGC